jgi:Xaa-Pro aminopeptidase
MVQELSQRPNAGIPRLTQGERSRRFAAVRTRMKERGVDALVMRSDSTKWDSGSAAGRYFTQIGGNGEEGYVVFDLREDPTFLIWGPGHIDNWLAGQDWTTDIRPSTPSASEAIAARLQELDVHRRRIGVVGRVGVSQLARDGQWPDSAWRSLVRELPQASFVDFDEDLASVRARKSAEEISCAERAMAATEAAVEALYEHARIGTQASVVAGRMIEALLRGGSEMCASVLLGTAAQGRLATRLWPQRQLARGDVIRTEIGGKYAGYWAQAHVPVALGEPLPIVRRLYEVMREGFDQGLAAVRPGAVAQDVVRAIRAPAQRAGYPIELMPAFKGIGLAVSEFPEGAPGMAAELQENMLITLQPTAFDPASGIGLHMSETVLVGATGGRRLGRRSLDLRVVS